MTWSYARLFHRVEIGDVVEVWDKREKRGPIHLAIVTDKNEHDMRLSFRLYHERGLPWLTINRYGFSWRWRFLARPKIPADNPRTALDMDCD